MNEIRRSAVHRNLDAKLKIVGFEVHDLLFVLVTASVMNLVFGRTRIALYLVFLLPALMALVLFFVKRNKPEQFLVHFMRYHMNPGFFSAGARPMKAEQMNTSIVDERE